MSYLRDLALKWGTDKALFYADFYDELLGAKRMDVRKVLELGIGYPATMLESVSRMGRTEYTTGASLFMWEEYFPNAEIVALDNKPEIFINRGRIFSYFVDQMDPATFDTLYRDAEEFDFIVEDGHHSLEAQALSAQKLIPLVKPGGTYVTEDVGDWHEQLRAAIPYPSELVDFGEARIVVVRR